jgi:hypothetical protein
MCLDWLSTSAIHQQAGVQRLIIPEENVLVKGKEASFTEVLSRVLPDVTMSKVKAAKEDPHLDRLLITLDENFVSIESATVVWFHCLCFCFVVMALSVL